MACSPWLKKSASKTILLYEDRADISLAGATSIPAGSKVVSWHIEPNRHSFLFLDGHADNFVLDFKKVMDHNYDTTNRPNFTCSGVTGKCLNGTGKWVARQDFDEQ